MLDFFGQVLGYLETMFEALTNTLNATLQSLVFLSTASGSIFHLLGFVPLIVSSFVIIVIAFGIVKFVLAR